MHGSRLLDEQVTDRLQGLEPVGIRDVECHGRTDGPDQSRCHLSP